VRLVDVSKAKEKLGFVSEIDLESGLSDTISWFTENRQHILDTIDRSKNKVKQ